MSRTNKHNIKAIFTDLDGTLLGSDHKISSRTLHVLQRIQTAYNDEIPFVVATGRPYADVFGALKDCGLEPHYIITSNGARIHDRRHQLVSKRDLDVEFLREAIAEAHAFAARPHPTGEPPAVLHAEGGGIQCSLDFLKGRQFATNLYREADWLVDLGCPAFRDAYHPSCDYEEKGVDGLKHLSEKELEGTHELFFVGPFEQLKPFSDFMQERYATEAKCAFSLPFLLDCVSADVDKGKAVEEVAALLGISPTEVAAFGDGMNDEAMLRTAGHPFIMQNANPALKAALPHAPVIGSNAEDGVACQLEALFF